MKWIYRGLRNLLCGVLHSMSLQLLHQQRTGVYIYCVALHIHSRHTNVSAPSKLNTQWVGLSVFHEGCQFIDIFTKSMHKSQCVHCIISLLLAVFWAFQSFCIFVVSFSYTYLQRVFIGVSAFIVLLVVCLFYFEPFRVFNNFSCKT